MSLVTSQQQGIIDVAIESYINTHDVVAHLYLKFRQSVLEVANVVAKEKLESGEISEETKKRLQQLNFESEKFKISYPSYVERLLKRVEFEKSNTPQYLKELEKDYVALSEKNMNLKATLKTLKDTHAPIVDKMSTMVRKFEHLFASGRGQHWKTNFRSSSTIGFRDQKPNANSTLIDYELTVFERKELEQSLQELDIELRKLKTVDAIDGTEGGEKIVDKRLHSIDTLKHLDDLLLHSRACRRIDTRVSFDLSRSPYIPKDAEFMIVDEYEQTIQSLAEDIKGLVARGAGAKERWLANAKRLQAIEDVLRSFDEPMEVD